jgi:hypothetical protein
MQLTIAMQSFNEKVRQMNQTNGKQLVLSAAEARNLHVDLYALLAEVTVLARNEKPDDETMQISMDGGGFKQ